MPKYPRLYKRGNTYYHRTGVPKDIRETYGKAEETFSLKTTDYKEAVKRLKKATIEVDERFDAHRLSLIASNAEVVESLTPEQIRSLRDLYYSQALKFDDWMRLESFRNKPLQRVEDLEGSIIYTHHWA